MSTPLPTIAADIEARLKVLEAKAEAEETKISTWIKTNWAHFVTWAALAYPLIKKML
jgi:hypothetical protein